MPRSFHVVGPRRRLRAGDDAGDVGVLAGRHVAGDGLLVFQVLAASGLLLLLFLSGAFARTLVLSRSKLGHVTSAGRKNAEPGRRLGNLSYPRTGRLLRFCDTPRYPCDVAVAPQAGVAAGRPDKRGCVKLYTKGSRVSQATYGTGTVSSSDERYTVIEFDNHGTKRFVTDIVTLEKSDEPAPNKPAKEKRKKAVKKEA
jgi:hypothetical protein